MEKRYTGYETRYKGYYIDRREFTYNGKTDLARVGVEFTYINNEDGMQDEREEKVSFLSWIMSVNEFLNKIISNDKK